MNSFHIKKRLSYNQQRAQSRVVRHRYRWRQSSFCLWPPAVWKLRKLPPGPHGCVAAFWLSELGKLKLWENDWPDQTKSTNTATVELNANSTTQHTSITWFSPVSLQTQTLSEIFSITHFMSDFLSNSLKCIFFFLNIKYWSYCFTMCLSLSWQ